MNNKQGCVLELFLITLMWEVPARLRISSEYEFSAFDYLAFDYRMGRKRRTHTINTPSSGAANYLAGYRGSGSRRAVEKEQGDLSIMLLVLYN